MIEYRFFINNTVCHPIYKDDTQKNCDRESEQVFFRESLSNNFSLIREEYDWLDSQDFDTEFIFLIERSTDTGLNWSTYFTGSFYKTDCKWNSDDKKVEFKISVKDQYTEVLAGLDKEYNIIKLNPVLKSVYLHKRPLLQYYILGQSTITCFLSNLSWEQEVENVVSSHATLITHHFALSSQLQKSLVTRVGNATPNDLDGEWVNKFVFDLHTVCMWYSKDEKYKLVYTPTSWNDTDTVYKFEIFLTASNNLLFNLTARHSATIHPLNNTFTLNAAGSGATGTVTIYNSTIAVYSRYILDAETYFGNTTYAIKANDIVSDNKNYKYCIGYAIDLCKIYNGTQIEPSEYGLISESEYFKEPYEPLFNRKHFPLSKTTWTLSSYWFRFLDTDEHYELNGRKIYKLKDTFPISSVISVLLHEVAPSITHQATAEYSQFLYGATNPISGDCFELLLSPKSNITRGQYDTPAKKAIVTLGNILDGLYSMFKCKWYIDNNKLKIEHISYFKNGLSYSSEIEPQYDLAKMLNMKTKKNWGLNMNVWEYNKSEMPERIDFTWMEGTTKAFEGYPIEIVSKYISRGIIQTNNVPAYTSDIDYMLLNPNAISLDGFAILAAKKADLIITWPSYGDLHSSTDGPGYTEPKIRIKNEFTANISVLDVDIDIEFNADFLDLVFYDIDGVIIQSVLAEFLSGSPDGHYHRTYYNVLPPSSAHYIGFSSSSGGMTVVINSFTVPDYLEVPFVSKQIGNTKYIMQNGLLSWIKLHEYYHLHDLPAKIVKINTKEVNASSIQKGKVQKIQLPLVENIQAMALIKTNLGNGLIDKVSANMTSLMNEITLVYDTE